MNRFSQGGLTFLAFILSPPASTRAAVDLDELRKALEQDEKERRKPPTIIHRERWIFGCAESAGIDRPTGQYLSDADVCPLRDFLFAALRLIDLACHVGEVFGGIGRRASQHQRGQGHHRHSAHQNPRSSSCEYGGAVTGVNPVTSDA